MSTELALSTELVVSVSGVVVLILLIVGGIVTAEFISRQRRVLQMKRFRREVRAPKVEFSEADKRTMV
jgi:hypothetical protein